MNSADVEAAVEEFFERLKRLDTARVTQPWTLVVNKPAEMVFKFKIFNLKILS